MSDWDPADFIVLVGLIGLIALGIAQVVFA
jgi:uncharacterized membrane protein